MFAGPAGRGATRAVKIYSVLGLQPFSSNGTRGPVLLSRPQSLLKRAWQPIAYFTFGTAASFAAAAAWEDAHSRDRVGEKAIAARPLRTQGHGAEPSIFNARLRRAWQELKPADRLVVGLLAANVAIFGVWQVPFLRPLASRYFLQRLPPAAPSLFTSISSTFSHASTLHLLANGWALWTIGRLTCSIMGPSQFLAFYMSAGLCASSAAFLGRLGSRGGAKSLGASGALLGCFAALAVNHPELQVNLIFLPNLDFRLADLLGGAMLLDIIGIVFRWRYLDHYAHLGGAVFGVLYVLWGQRLWERRRQLLGKRS